MYKKYDYDVVVVGGSIAGCTTAVLYGRSGLRVALIEQSADPGQYKQLCTHFLQPMAVPTIRKLGLDRLIERAGGVRSQVELWTRWGLICAGAGSIPYGYSIRRQTLDPLVRGLATRTPGVELHTGTSARGLLRHASGRVEGVVTDSPTGSREFRAPLVVAADGRLSRLATLAGVEAHPRPNRRFSYYRYYRNLPLTGGANAQCWHLGARLAFGFKCDGGLTLLGLFQPTDELRDFKQDLSAGFRRFWEGIPGGPEIDRGEPVGPLRGYAHLPNQWRPAGLPGLALVGDAAMVLDPIWGTGCGFAFLSADWLVAATLSAFGRGDATSRAIDCALRRYRRIHRARTRWHFGLIADFSRVRGDNLIERLVFSAATRDAELARKALTYLGRTVGGLSLGAPSTLARAALVNARHFLSGPKPPVARPLTASNAPPRPGLRHVARAGVDEVNHAA